MNINQPNNSLVNHLGITNMWYSYVMNINKFTKHSSFNYINISNFLHVLFRNGLIFYNHPFISKFFFRRKGIYTLPLVRNRLTFAKYYRFFKIRGAEEGAKQAHTLRKYMEYINMSSIFFFKMNSWFLILFHIYIPLVKRTQNSFVFEQKGDKDTAVSIVPLYYQYCNPIYSLYSFYNIF